MNIVLFCPRYPSPSFHGYSFVHARAKLYQQFGHNVLGVYLSKEEIEYEYESIPVKTVTKSSLEKYLEDYEADVIAVHFPLVSMIQALKGIKVPQVAWIHGGEILWRFKQAKQKSILTWIKKKIVLIPREFVQIFVLRNYIKKISKSIFVSNWIKNMAEKHALAKFNNAAIIPNPVDTNLFSYVEKKCENKGISVRAFDHTKYGLDLIIKALSNEKDIEIDIFGKGLLADKYRKMKQKLNSNINVIERSIPHNEIPNLYKNYNYFVAPSRIETQGLAMCEAMSCGLPIVATKVGGIPEYVRDGIDGILVPPNNPKAILEAVKKLTSNPDKMKEMGKNASSSINRICSQNVVIKKELEILEKAMI